MDNRIKQQLKIKKVRKMKKPIILMNSDDFDSFKQKLESTIQNYKTSKCPTYEGIPIKTNNVIERGCIVVYDDVFNCLTNLLNTLKTNFMELIINKEACNSRQMNDL